MWSEVFIANGITCVFVKAATIVSINVTSVQSVKYDSTQFFSSPHLSWGPEKRYEEEISAYHTQS
jgi:hypothetical protein